MDEDVRKEYEKVKEIISEEEFLERFEQKKEENKDNPFFTDGSVATLVVGELKPEGEVEKITSDEKNAAFKIDELLDQQRNVNISGRIMQMSNPKPFANKKNQGQVCNLTIADDTGSIRVVFWTENIRLLKEYNEGDLIKIIDVDVRNGYSGLEANLKRRSTVKHLTEEECPNFPKYNEVITNIEDIEFDDDITYTIIARIVKIPNIRTYEKNGREGKVASLELQDATGKISYTLWNKNVELIDSLELHEGDTVKIIGAVPRKNRDEISLTHWDGRIVKGDFDVPEFEEKITKIGEVREMQGITVLGVITKLQDVRTFIRSTDNTEGKLRSFSIADGTGEIRVTLWGDDADMDINKGDIVKIIDGNGRFDNYTDSGYSLNTNWNTQIVLNPQVNDELAATFEEIAANLHPVTLEAIQECDDDGLERDVVGRMMVIHEPLEFERDDGNFGFVRTILFADGTDKVDLALWGDKASDNTYKLGGLYRIENARTRLGEYNVELNVGASSRIIELTDEEAEEYNIPSFEELEEFIYTYRSIDDLEEDERDIKVIARIVEVYEPREFERGDGSSGLVRNIEIADDSGSIRLVLWDANAEMPLEVDDPIKLENPRVMFNEDRLELSTTRNTSILDPSEEEINALPTPDELKELIYPQKEINALEDDDRNVRITGVFRDPSNNLVLARCPSCGNRLEPDFENDDGSVCSFCGDVIDEPNYLLLISGRFEDDTGEVQITFFDNLVAELLEMKKEEIISYIEDEGVGVFEGKIDDLDGMTMEVIANIRFDEFNEEIRLNPKKILDKYY